MHGPVVEPPPLPSLPPDDAFPPDDALPPVAWLPPVDPPSPVCPFPPLEGLPPTLAGAPPEPSPAAPPKSLGAKLREPGAHANGAKVARPNAIAQADCRSAREAKKLISRPFHRLRGAIRTHLATRACPSPRPAARTPRKETPTWCSSPCRPR